MASADRLPVLTYHAIDTRVSVVSTPPGEFRGQMEALAQHGLRGVSLAQAFACLERDGHFPPDSVVLTFDDGYLSVISEGLPVLAARGFTATVFLVSGLVGLRAAAARARNADFDRDLLDWRQAAELLQAGFEIGSHTVSHPDLTRLAPTERERELAAARTQLEQGLQTPVQSLAYPYGRLDPEVRDAAARHYRRACTTRLARCGPATDPLRIDRIDMYYMKPARRFQELLDGGLDHWLRARRLLRAMKRLAQ
jgi:peptidoglycan/xylan/chitin deacetylase (PgdA/CDA1 family)